MSLKLNSSGGGSVTLQEPSTASNQTVTLPDATTTVVGTDTTQTLTNKTLTSPTLTTPNIDSAQFATVSGTAPLYAARAWVNFNGSGTVAIRSSGNISSITDNGTGNYTLNFTNAMPDANYSACSMGRLDTSSDDRIPDIGIRRGVAPTTSALRVQCTEGISTAFDCDYVTVAVFR